MRGFSLLLGLALLLSLVSVCPHWADAAHGHACVLCTHAAQALLAPVQPSVAAASAAPGVVLVPPPAGYAPRPAASPRRPRAPPLVVPS